MATRDVVSCVGVRNYCENQTKMSKVPEWLSMGPATRWLIEECGFELSFKWYPSGWTMTELTCGNERIEVRGWSDGPKHTLESEVRRYLSEQRDAYADGIDEAKRQRRHYAKLTKRWPVDD